MARFAELENEIAAQVQRPVIRLADRELLRGENVGQSVQLASSGFELERSFGEEDRGTVACGRGGIHRSVEAMPHQLRGATGGGEAGIREQDGVDLRGIEWQLAILFCRLRDVA